MVWLTWRHHRAQLLVTAALLVALGAFLLAHGLRTADIAAALTPGSAEWERVLGQRFTQVFRVLAWLAVVPAAVGLFWGAPLLAREFERGTHTLAWTQSVSRRRWAAVKLGGLGIAVTAAGLALGGMVGAWLSSFGDTTVASAFRDSSLFAISGVAAGAWWLFAFALGAAAGAVTRRTMPAAAVTVAGFWLVFWAVLEFARERYATPVRIVPTETSPIPDGALVARYVQEGPELAWYYHPPERYWQFQWTEAGLLLLLALALTGVAVFRTLRRRG